MKVLTTIMLFVVLVVGITVLFTYPAMWIINYVFAPKFLTFVFGVSKLGFWRTFWAVGIITALFKGNSSSK